MNDLMRGAALVQFPSLVSSLGGDADALMRTHGVDPDAAGSNERLSWIAPISVCVSPASRV